MPRARRTAPGASPGHLRTVAVFRRSLVHHPLRKLRVDRPGPPLQGRLGRRARVRPRDPSELERRVARDVRGAGRAGGRTGQIQELERHRGLAVVPGGAHGPELLAAGWGAALPRGRHWRHQRQGEPRGGRRQQDELDVQPRCRCGVADRIVGADRHRWALPLRQQPRPLRHRPSLRRLGLQPRSADSARRRAARRTGAAAAAAGAGHGATAASASAASAAAAPAADDAQLRPLGGRHVRVRRGGSHRHRPQPHRQHDPGAQVGRLHGALGRCDRLHRSDRLGGHQPEAVARAGQRGARLHGPARRSRGGHPHGRPGQGEPEVTEADCKAKGQAKTRNALIACLLPNRRVEIRATGEQVQ